MKAKILALGLICVFFLSCYMRYSQRLIYYPQTPDILYDQMLETLKDLDYTITSDEKTPDLIVSKHPFIIGNREKHKAMITFYRRHAETEIEIHISQIGEKTSTQFLDQKRDEIELRFSEIMKDLK